MAGEKNVQAQDINQLLKVRRDKLKDLQDNGKDPFVITKYDVTHHSQEVIDNFDALDGKTVTIAGRMMTKRVMGKASFCKVQDLQGIIQSYVARDSIGEEEYKAFKKMDIGDIVGLKGEVFKTKTGEISIHASEVTLLSKSLQILPEKFHGLTNTDIRYRQRYVDLIMNPEVKQNFVLRSKFVKHVRDFMDARGYIEVETPVLNTISGGATARPFITHHNTLDIDMYMRIATELHLKRLVVGGFERVYEIGRIFRNEGMDPKHNPEFTTIELYEAYADFHDMMDIAEGVLSTAAKDILGGYNVRWLGEEIDLTPGWKRLTMIDAVRDYVGVDFDAVSDDEQACKAVEAAGVDLEGCERTWGTALYEAFDQRVEEKLIQPTFITDYPREMSPLCKRHRSNPELTERFELFVNGKELCNAYSELNDPIDQLERFQEQLQLSEKGDDEAMFIDMDFVRALEYGMPSCSGMGIGIDRLTMFMTDQASIQDVLFFPQMRPEKKVVNDPVEKYTAAGIPEEWVPVIQKMGYITVEALKKLAPGKFFNDLCGFNKKNKLGLKAPSMEEVKKWCEQE